MENSLMFKPVVNTVTMVRYRVSGSYEITNVYSRSITKHVKILVYLSLRRAANGVNTGVNSLDFFVLKNQ
jgi:hypothetical protein